MDAARQAARWAAFVIVGWSGEDGYGGQDGEEEGERGGEMHGGCCLFSGSWFLRFGCGFLCVCD